MGSPKKSGGIPHASSISGHLVKFILNLFLISEKVDHVHWLRSDKRSVHLTEVLKAEKGSVLDFAVENGPKGKGNRRIFGRA